MCTCTHVSLYGLRQFSVISSLQTGIIAAAGPGMRTAPSRTRRCSCSAAALLCCCCGNARAHSSSLCIQAHAAIRHHHMSFPPLILALCILAPLSQLPPLHADA